MNLRSKSALWPLVMMVFALLVSACMPVQPTADGGASETAPSDPAASMADGETMTLFVNSERVECTGVGPMMCLQVRESQDADWQFFYSGIDGFFFVPGFLYELVVNVTPVENAPADASSLAYTLVEVVSKEPAYTGESVALVGPTWLLRAFGEEAMVAYDETVSPVTLIFGEDGSLAGNAGCNNIIGGFADDGSNLTIGPLGTTMMMCEEAAMAVESAFTSAFTGEPQPYTIRGDMLEIVYAAGVLTFQAQGMGEATVVEDAGMSEPLSLEGTEWTLASMDEAMGVAFDPAMVEVTALFDGTRVGGTSGCNQYGGDYTVEDTTITFGMMISTMMACPDPQASVETAYLQALQAGPSTFVIEGNTLILTTPNGLLTYTGVAAAADDAAASGGSLPLVDTDWTLVVMDEAMGVAYDPVQGAVTMHFNEDGSVSGNAGCNNFNGGFTDDGATITFTPLATTRMLCPEAQMGVENAMLAVLDGSVQYSIEGSTLTMTSTSGTLVFEGVPAVAEDAAAADEALPPFGTLWTLVSFDENMAVEFDPAVTTVTATFTEDGQVSGNSGCNNYFGGFTVDGTLVTFEPLGGTRMMCEEPANSVEFAFLNAMQGEALYQINGSTLELITGEGTLTFTGTPAAAESAPADTAFTGTTWSLMAFDENMAVEFDPTVVAVEITFADDGSVSGNGGCNNFSGGYSVEGSFITFGALATTMMACPDPASTVEAAVFGALQGEAQVQISGNTMELITGVGTLTFVAQ